MNYPEAINKVYNITMENKIKFRVCLRCNGTGKVANNYYYRPEIRKQAIYFRNKGFTLRRIGKILNINNPQSVKSLINSKDKN